MKTPNLKDRTLLSGPTFSIDAFRPSGTRPFTFDKAMRRLAYLMVTGCMLMISYGLAFSPDYLLSCSIGLMIAFAAAMGAGLVGFVFGVPYTKDQPAAIVKLSDPSDSSETDAAPSYRPNTSLEQISDWLTKMLVGVGLVEIKEIPDPIIRLVRFLARGLGGGIRSEAFVLSALVFFAVCGFLFGFLWARLYLRRWLSDADRDLIEKLSRFEADAQAYALVSQQLDRSTDESAVPDDRLLKAIHAASTPARARVFELAKAASEDQESSEYYDIKNPGAISIFKILITEDKQARYHRNHAELSYALFRQRPPDLAGAETAISEAIRRRDYLARKGWRFYEFQRGCCRIRQDENFSAGKASDQATAHQIEADLRVAASEDPKKWRQWLANNTGVVRWLQLNGLQID